MACARHMNGLDRDIALFVSRTYACSCLPQVAPRRKRGDIVAIESCQQVPVFTSSNEEGKDCDS